MSYIEFKNVCKEYKMGEVTIVFTLIVNFVTYFALKKIDMIESLKSVE